jgi:hypothetical protein
MAEEIEEKVSDEASAKQPIDEAPTAEATPKKKKWPIIVIVIVLVVAAAGVGFYFWHEQPSFCNAICHTPMDNYVEGYYDDNSGKLSNTHEQNGIKCLDCHEAVLSEQITEGIEWITGNYSVDSSGNITDGTLTATKDFCTRCHNWDDVVASTADWGGVSGVNPHSSHQGSLACSSCHSVHGTSTLYCNSCHTWQLPDGWSNPS